MARSAGTIRTEKEEGRANVSQSERAARTAVREIVLEGSDRSREAEELVTLRRELDRLSDDFRRLESETRAHLARFERVLNQELDHNAVSRLRDHFTHFKRDVEHSMTHISFALSEYHRAITELRSRLERYVNVPPLRYVRELRKRLFRL